jgi:hypothetical protein
MIKHFFSFAALLVLTAMGVGARDASSFFTDAKANGVFRLVDNTNRLDMVDYYDAGLTRPVKSFFEDSVIITSMTPEQIGVRYTPSDDMVLTVLPAGKDSVLMLIETFSLPIRDSHITFYSTDWKPLKKAPFKEPTLKDWLTNDTRANRLAVEDAIKFMFVKADYDPATKTLTLTNNTAQNFVDVPKALSLLKPSISYVWDGSAMKQVK